MVTLIRVPETGLFYDEATETFRDGKGNAVPWFEEDGILVFSFPGDAKKWREQRIASGKRQAKDYRVVKISRIGREPF
jgi:hypothetical protein